MRHRSTPAINLQRRAFLQKLDRDEAQCVVIDLERVLLIDSAGLGELTHLAASLRRSGGALFAIRPQRPFVHDLLVQTKVATLMYLFTWREPALAAAERWVLENSASS